MWTTHRWSTPSSDTQVPPRPPLWAFRTRVKGSGLLCHVTLNFNWIEAPLPANSAHVLTASDEEPGKITFWCPSFEQGDDQELVLGN